MKFAIRSIESIKFIDNRTGKELEDIRERKPFKQYFCFDTPILKLVQESMPGYEALNHPLIKQHSVYYGGVYEKFKWLDSLYTLDELSLWKIFGIIHSLDAAEYKYRSDIRMHEEYILDKEKRNMLKIQIKYFTDIEPIQKITKGDWIDLRAADTFTYRPGQRLMIPLGVAMKLPEGYEAHVVPRSSTFKNYGIIQTNSQGIIDNSYSGDNDQWHMPALAMDYGTIKKGDRVCQFRIVECMPQVEFETVETLTGPDRGGFGSTGKE